jgi:hypothetical protein
MQAASERSSTAGSEPDATLRKKRRLSGQAERRFVLVVPHVLVAAVQNLDIFKPLDQ